MKCNMLRVWCAAIFLYNTTQPFFWVPNRYTAPFWSNDTHITQGGIDSWDSYFGSSYGDSDYPNYRTIDFILSWYQTIIAGFFCEATMPLMALEKNGLSYENCTMLIGFGINHDMLPILDFVDFMLRTGVATPAHTPPLPVLRIETIYGYPDWGIPVAGDLALGIFNWLTLGMHASVCQFFSNPLVWHLQPYLKADHFLIGLSGWFGYSYTGAHHDAGSRVLFPAHPSWSMHTLHYGIEYEFIQSYFPIHPRLGAYYNQHISGEHAASRSSFGITVGLDITW
jgi:hypothetical protein